MKNTAPYWIAAAVLAIGLSANVLNAQEQAVDTQDNTVASRQDAPKPDPLPMPDHDHVIFLQPDGSLAGTANSIDPHTLHYVPAPNVDIAFVQNRRVVAQVRSNADGRFTVDGLSPRGVYSLIARTSNSYAAESVVVMPAEKPGQNAAARSNGGVIRNVVRTTAIRLKQGGVNLNLSLAPGGDIGAFPPGAGAGLGPGLGLGPGAGPAPAGPGAGTGGGGGGGGGGGSGLGAALGAAALATGITALASPN